MGGACDFAELPAIVVKGKDEPVDIWEPMQPANAQGETGAFANTPSEAACVAASGKAGRPAAGIGAPRAVARPYAAGGGGKSDGQRDRRTAAQVLKGTLGRHHEIARLRSCFTQLEGGESTCTLLVGESGIGKTHLVGVLRALHAEVNGSSDPLTQVGLLLNTSRPIEATTPFFLWRAIFERLFTTATLRELAARSIDYGRQPLTPSLQGAGASAGVIATADRTGAGTADAFAGVGFLPPAVASSERHDAPAHQRASSSVPAAATLGSLPSSPGARRQGRIFASGHSGATPGFGLGMLPKVQRSRARSPDRASAALSSAPASPKLVPSSPFRRFSRGNPAWRRSRGWAGSAAGSPLPMSARTHRPSPLGGGTPFRSMLSPGTPQSLGSAARASGVGRLILRGLRYSASHEGADAPAQVSVGPAGSSGSPGISRDGSAGSLSGHVPPWGLRRPPMLLSPADDEPRPSLWPGSSASNVHEQSSPAVSRPHSSSPALRNMPSRILSHLTLHRRSSSISPPRRWGTAAAPDESAQPSERSLSSRSNSKSVCDSRASSSHTLSPAGTPLPQPAPAGGRAASSPVLSPAPSGNLFGSGLVASYLGGLFGLGRSESFHLRESLADARELMPPMRQQRSQPFLLQRHVPSPPRRRSPRAAEMAETALPPYGRVSQLPVMPASPTDGVPRHPRQRWRDAVSTALAYTLPPHALGCAGSSTLEGQVCIRPQVGAPPPSPPVPTPSADTHLPPHAKR
jgi:hypothetical protein